MEKLRVADIAAQFGLSPATIRAYSHRRQMPQPDGYDKYGPWWNQDSIDGWDRPGPGRRRTTQY
jgi:hypothetical protein